MDFSKECPFRPPNHTNTNSGWFYTQETILLHHVLFDPGFGQTLMEFLGDQSVLDIGAGIGQFGYSLLQSQSKAQWTGFDGGNNIESLYNTTVMLKGNDNYIIPKVCWIDAARPFYLNQRFDWTLSVEVGEHIDKRFESTFMDNLVSHCRKGVILTWAVTGQGGLDHINNHDNEYIIQQMAKRNVTYEFEQSMAFRNSVTDLYWLVKTIMFF